MADKHRRVLSEEQLPDVESLDRGGTDWLTIDIYYHPGGMNYFQGQTEPRGYWLGCNVETRTPEYKSVSMFSGTRTFLLETKRFSPKILAELQPSASQIEHVRTDVLSKRQARMDRDRKLREKA